VHENVPIRSRERQREREREKEKEEEEEKENLIILVINDSTNASLRIRRFAEECLQTFADVP